MRRGESASPWVLGGTPPGSRRMLDAPFLVPDWGPVGDGFGLDAAKHRPAQEAAEGANEQPVEAKTAAGLRPKRADSGLGVDPGLICAQRLYAHVHNRDSGG